MKITTSKRLSKISRSRGGEAQIKIGHRPSAIGNDQGFLMLDLVVAVSILMLGIFPLAYSFVRETQLLRAEYHRAVAVEIVDGEMEILATGDWKHFSDGAQNYPVHARAAANLPPGKFQLIKTGNRLRLEWKSQKKSGIGPVTREITIR